MFECCLCGTVLHTSNPRMFWCSKCWADWSTEIKAKVPWTVFLQNLETRRRYREQDMQKNNITYIYLGDDDVYEEAGKYKILHKMEGE